MTRMLRRRPTPGAWFFAALAAALVVASMLVLRGAGAEHGQRDAVQQRDAETARKVELANVVLALCRSGAPVVDLVTLQDCVNARQAVTAPIVAAAQSDGVSVDQVRAVVLQELADYETRVGRPATESETLELVRRVYAENKPADGRSPTDAELMALILPAVEANKPADGRDCDPDVNPECRGPQGERGEAGARGAPGVGVERGDFVLIGPACVYRITLLDTETGTRSTADAPVPDALCAPPATEPPARPPLLGGG